MSRVPQAATRSPEPDTSTAAASTAALDLGRLLPPVDPGILRERLRVVVDPELGVNIVDLGLVYQAEVQAGVARIVMTTTSPACPIGAYLEDAVRRTLLDLPGVVDVDIEQTHEPAWSPARMTAAARYALGMPGA